MSEPLTEKRLAFLEELITDSPDETLWQDGVVKQLTAEVRRLRAERRQGLHEAFVDGAQWALGRGWSATWANLSAHEANLLWPEEDANG